MKIVPLVVISLFLYIPNVFCAQREDLFNPNPDADDVILQMPCNFKMVFRKVYTSNNNSDKFNYFEFNDGDENTLSPLTQSKYKCRVQGAFHDEKGYFMLISKYELMSAQYLALSSSTCPILSKKAFLPAVNLSYKDFSSAASLYSNFLQKQNNVPSEDKQKAFVSLPANCEWSFAARGGLLVSKDNLENSRFTFKDGLEHYAWFSGSSSANGKLQLPGLKKPNPLGLYDMLGNAMELMEDRFTVVLNDNTLGQRGALTVRGGSFLSVKEHISEATRTEKPFYNSKGDPLKAKDIGTRFVLGLPILTSIQNVRKLNDSFSKTVKKEDQQSIKEKINAQKLALKAKKLSQTEEKLTQIKMKLGKNENELVLKEKQLNQKALELEQKAEYLSKKEQKLAISISDKSKLSKDEPLYTDLNLQEKISSDNIDEKNLRIDINPDEQDVASILSEDEFSLDGKKIDILDIYNGNLKDQPTKQSNFKKSRVVNEIAAQYAPFYYEKEVWTCGVLAQIKNLSNNVLLNLDERYPNQNLTVMINVYDFNNLEQEYGKFSSKIGKKVCAFGKIIQYKDNFEIILKNNSDLEIR